MRVSPQCVHGLGGLRQGTRGRLRLWGRLSRLRGSSRVPPPPGVLFHPPSLDPPPRQINLANIVVHGGIIEQIQDQQREHEEAVNPHSQQRRVVAGEREAETEPHSQKPRPDCQHLPQVDKFRLQALGSTPTCPVSLPLHCPLPWTCPVL